MSRAELITWIAALEETDPRLEKVSAIRKGENHSSEVEPYLSLKETAAAVRKDASWLWKLRVSEHCGERLAGRFMCRVSRVTAYLKSQKCQERIQELHRERKSRERIKLMRGGGIMGDLDKSKTREAFIPAWLDDAGLSTSQFRVYCHIVVPVYS